MRGQAHSGASLGLCLWSGASVVVEFVAVTRIRRRARVCGRAHLRFWGLGCQSGATRGLCLWSFASVVVQICKSLGDDTGLASVVGGFTVS
jgi:hypothetical protein